MSTVSTRSALDALPSEVAPACPNGNDNAGNGIGPLGRAAALSYTTPIVEPPLQHRTAPSSDLRVVRHAGQRAAEERRQEGAPGHQDADAGALAGGLP